MNPLPARAASGLAYAKRASPDLATQAVAQALQRLGRQRAGQILLFLSADFAADPRSAVLAAARAGQTLAVTGCTAVGVLTEADWIWDAPAACALVLAETELNDTETALTFAAPTAIDLSWLERGTPRYGGVAGDMTGLGPFKVWHRSQIVDAGHCELPMPHASVHVSCGLRAVGEPLTVSEVAGFDLRTLNGRQAATTLRRSIQRLPPTHELALALVDDDNRTTAVLPVVSINPDDSVTVAGRLLPSERVRWMQRDAATALTEVSDWAAASPPDFALFFSCAGRGPTLHGAVDREWQALRDAWPGTPIVGFYGNGQIAHLGGINQLLHRCVVVARFD